MEGLWGTRIVDVGRTLEMLRWSASVPRVSLDSSTKLAGRRGRGIVSQWQTRRLSRPVERMKE